MRMLITGGAGCLGSNLIKHWLPKGYKFLVIDNFATGRREALPHNDQITMKTGTIADESLVQDCFQNFQPDLVIHTAAAYKDPENWAEDIQTNILGSAYIARAASMHQVRKMIYFQTTLCYGHPQQLPIPISHPTAPFSSYGISKTAGEQYALLNRVPTLSLRLANIAGPNLAIGPVPTFYQRLKAGKPCFCTQASRDFLDISDFLRLMDMAIVPEAPVGIFNVASGERHTIQEVFDLVTKHLGLGQQKVPIVPVDTDDVADVALDISDTCHQFKWKPQVKFEEIIQRQLHWYDQHGVQDIFSHLKTKPIAIDSTSQTA